MNFRLVVWSFGRLVVLTKTLITPVNGISLSDFCCTLSAIAIKGTKESDPFVPFYLRANINKLIVITKFLAKKVNVISEMY